jgi:hypothetical protein
VDCVWPRTHIPLRVLFGVRAHGPVQGMCLPISHTLGAVGRPLDPSVPYFYSDKGRVLI